MPEELTPTSSLEPTRVYQTENPRKVCASIAGYWVQQLFEARQHGKRILDHRMLQKWTENDQTIAVMHNRKFTRDDLLVRMGQMKVPIDYCWELEHANNDQVWLTILDVGLPMYRLFENKVTATGTRAFSKFFGVHERGRGKLDPTEALYYLGIVGQTRENAPFKHAMGVYTGLEDIYFCDPGKGLFKWSYAELMEHFEVWKQERGTATFERVEVYHVDS